MENETRENVSTKMLITVCMAFFVAFALFAILLSLLISHTLLLVFLSTLMGSYIAINVFVRHCKGAPMKQEQLKISRLCLLIIVFLQIPLILSSEETMELIFSGIDGILVLLLSGGMTLVLYYIFIRVSFDLFGALERNKQKKVVNQIE